MKFEWDEHKNKLNIQKHGVDFKDAVYVFSDPFALNLPDSFSENEERWMLLGINLKEQVLLVIHTFRYENVTRIISARKATNKEKSTYLQRAKR
ncbi:MAG: BrnT family toxin [Methylococcales bacterium]|jgi:hypothetical protein|nr:BrnT family toxin [Methylococcales bacterium]